ncbi:acyl carrier protein [Legionella sp. km772]|uniref:acyl carrier protein n=1 Tax=Legionella sp. km772 TaxID=2498111 RepID=UPI000F8CF296|nr:acyl carrier protein [Legionella sp. km772]RUR07929.1 acyl carrier protein [Legionella sp. km772]
MNRETIVKKTQEVFRDIFDEPSLVIYNEMSSNNLASWDSLHHINLLIAIQNEFQIKFDLQEIQRLKNVGAIIDLVWQKQAQ